MQEDDIIKEDGEGGAPDGAATPDSVNGMGEPVLAGPGVDGSGDVPSIAKKKKRRIKNFFDFVGIRSNKDDNS